MVYEVRTIVLNNEEMAMALNTYRRHHPDFLPLGKILDCEVRDEAELVAMVEAECAGVKKPVERKISNEALLEPMIQFCIENNIMLPKRGRKMMVFDGGQPALYVEMRTFIAGGFVAEEYEGEA